MASGDYLFELSALNVMAPAANFATFDTHAGGATPAESKAVYDFDAAAIEYIDFFIPALPKPYSGLGLTFRVKFGMSSDSTATDKVRIEIAIRRKDTAEDFGGAHSYAFNGVSPTIPDDVDKIKEAQVTFTNGVDMDSWVLHEPAYIRVRRKIDHADDNASGDMEFNGIAVHET